MQDSKTEIFISLTNLSKPISPLQSSFQFMAKFRGSLSPFTLNPLACPVGSVFKQFLKSINFSLRFPP